MRSIVRFVLVAVVALGAACAFFGGIPADGPDLWRRADARVDQVGRFIDAINPLKADGSPTHGPPASP